jgi:enoyl-CoA hydratase/carnithine racemase
MTVESDGAADTVLIRSGDTLVLRFARPDVHNALTIAMYEQLVSVCAQVREDSTVRCLVLRGVSGGAFAAGTDISHFRAVASGADGVAYEASVQRVLEALLDLPIPTLAVVEGYALGGGMMLAAACDVRVCTPDARFGVPIARTLGNCLSQFGYDLIADRLGSSRTVQMLLTAQLLDGAAAAAAGFVLEVVDPDELEGRVAQLCRSFSTFAPMTLGAIKSADRARRAGDSTRDDYVRACYGSRDFAEGVSAFLQGRKPEWTGS